MGNIGIEKTVQRNYLIWVESAICRESSCAKQKFIVSFCSVQQTVKCSKVNNGCDKPCVSYNIRHVRGMMTSSNGNIFRVTGHLCVEFTGPRWIPRTKASDAELWCFFDLRLNERLSKKSWGWWLETPSRPLRRHRNAWITRHNCTVVSAGGSRELIRQSVRSSPMGYRTVSALARAMHGLWEAGWERKVVVPELDGALQHAAAYSGWGLDTVVGHAVLIAWDNTHGLCGYSDVIASWCSATVLVCGLHWFHKCFKRICQSFDDMVAGGSPQCEWFQVVPISCRRCVNHIIVVCGTLKRLAPSAVLNLVCSIPNVLSLSTMMRP